MQENSEIVPPIIFGMGYQRWACLSFFFFFILVNHRLFCPSSTDRDPYILSFRTIIIPEKLVKATRKTSLIPFPSLFYQQLIKIKMSAPEIKELHPLILQLANIDLRETALLELSKKREAFPDLAPVLWHSYGTIAALLQEIISIYPMLSPPTLSPHASNRVCNALALLQCIASHPETKSKLMNAHIPLYLYPFLNTVSRHRPFEYLRLTSLGVIGALVKVSPFS